ncbi:hypothetical protein BEL04_06515 [Mucilaginibacter sp. PPCGB 2223]|uniref:FkbM family methyltransferase n=1 Tax=Mucilaginibacter sp. PPCGB 2223 TaxID=1886027 RepID=UPI0008251FF4|nr:FkbM family methyltransferase [Mucilaginibacter sp. PPCGB 2223]OCX53928.1 hypothetical protein BEL04_06515 [Mucilaginibacter sp. PPCGB 2223]
MSYIKKVLRFIPRVTNVIVAELLYPFRKIKQTHTTKLGVKLSINDPVISRQVFREIVKEHYEAGENDCIRTTLEPDDIYVELGCGVGFNSITAQKISKNKVVAFEANPKLISLIKKNMALNHIAFDVHNEIVVSNDFDKNEIDFFIKDDHRESSIFSEIDGKPAKIKVIKLNDLIKKYNPTYFCVDIEGGEVEIFKDVSFLKNSNIKKIALEFHPSITGEKVISDIVRRILNEGFYFICDDFNKNFFYFIRL